MLTGKQVTLIGDDAHPSGTTAGYTDEKCPKHVLKYCRGWGLELYWAGKERTAINPAEQREGVRISDIPMKEPGMDRDGPKEPPDYTTANSI